MDNSQDYIIIQHRSDSPNSRSVNNSTAKDQEMLTPLINMAGHAASEQLMQFFMLVCSVKFWWPLFAWLLLFKFEELQIEN